MPPFVRPTTPLQIRYNRWTFLRQGSGSLFWVMRCDCGVEKEVNKKNVKSGASKSCGCHNIQRLKERRTNPDLPEFSNWRSMIGRCTDENDPGYERYGGRGITVCERWLNSFEAFYEDMGPKPTPDHSIDRKDNDKGYCKENCRWATRSEQQRNKTTTKMYEMDGRSQCLAAWAEEFEIEAGIVGYRLKEGWGLRAALTVPKGRPRGRQAGKPETRLIEWNGVTKTMGEWAEEFGIPVRLFNERVRKGWTMERIKLQPLSHLAKR